MVGTTTTKRSTVAKRFLNAEAGVVYHAGRLATVPMGDTIALVAYGNEVLAEITEDGSEVTFYIGHHSQVSKTVTGYIKKLGSVLGSTSGKTVDIRRDAAPTLGVGSRVDESSQYIDNYVGGFGDAYNLSPVERDAKATVEQSLRQRMRELLGE